MRKRLLSMIAAVIAVVASASAAQLAAPAAVVSDDVLAEVRGGFVTANGVEVSFAVDSVVFVNGVLQASTHYPVEGQDVSAISTTGAGTGEFDATVPAVLVHNSLDGQTIRTITTITATVSAANFLRNSHLSNLITTSLIGGR